MKGQPAVGMGGIEAETGHDLRKIRNKLNHSLPTHSQNTRSFPSIVLKQAH
jgi:hypothetical protein